jgi:hypothetical protein
VIGYKTLFVVFLFSYRAYHRFHSSLDVEYTAILDVSCVVAFSALVALFLVLPDRYGRRACVSFKKWVAQFVGQDLRADQIALSDLKHKDPMLMEVSVFDPKSMKSRRLVISYELYTQLTVNKNMTTSIDGALAYQRFNFHGSSINSVNLSRHLCSEYGDVVQNTIEVSNAMRARLVAKSRKLPFRGWGALTEP